jgi:hypothetical protein
MRSDTEPASAVDWAAQQDAFRRDGFAVVPGLFGAEEIARISAWADELERLPEVPGRAMKYFEPTCSVRASACCSGSRTARSTTASRPCATASAPRLRVPALGEAAVLFKDKINFKPRGDGFKPHQDQQAGWTASPSCSSPPWSASTGPRKPTAASSCAPGTTRAGSSGKVEAAHRRGHAAPRRPPVPTRPGDAVFFDSTRPTPRART